MAIELFCPVTGQKVTRTPDWINQKVSDTLVANYWIVGGSIIYSRPEGFADLAGAKNILSLNEKVSRALTNAERPYVQIKDYSHLKGASSEARRLLIKELDADNRRLWLLYCNLSHSLSIAVKLGKRFSFSGKSVHVVKNYDQAARKALDICKQQNLPIHYAPVDLTAYSSGDEKSLAPIEIISDSAFDIQTKGYSNRAVVVDRCIMHSTSVGYLEPKHIEFIDLTRSRCQSAIPDGGSLEYIVVDVSGLSGANRLARQGYMKSLIQWHQRHPIKAYIVYGANTFIKTALFLSNPVMPFKVKLAKNVQQALALIRHEASEIEPSKGTTPDSGKSVTVTEDEINNLSAIIGSINWEEKGMAQKFDEDEGHPLYFLYQSIKLIKEELDELFEERQNLEDQLFQARKMETIGTLASGISHDFNNILNIILGNSELALMDIHDSDAVRSALKAIRTASMHASEIVDQLLAFSAKPDSELHAINAVIPIEDELNRLQSVIPKNITIHRHLPHEGIPILGNPDEIKQIISNLCRNAVQSMGKKGGRIDVTAEPSVIAEDDPSTVTDLKPGAYLKIMVRDTGLGINPTILDRIFDPYFSSSGIGRRPGMGLAIVHGHVSKCGGAITVDSQPGRGTTFSVLLPILCGLQIPERQMDFKVLRGTESILLIDDENIIMEITQTMLERIGYRVESRGKPSEALAIFRQRPYDFDLVITDTTMPEMSGIDLSERLQEIRPDIPIIITTGRNDKMDEIRSQEKGFAACLPKPLGFKFLAETIRKVLNDR